MDIFKPWTNFAQNKASLMEKNKFAILICLQISISEINV